ncbi:MAG: hypothetical protein HYU63_03240 [Armatimonadetes bacterium]|nr:hypothetical protein [Armatimonadota bacterium]
MLKFLDLLKEVYGDGFNLKLDQTKDLISLNLKLNNLSFLPDSLGLIIENLALQFSKDEKNLKYKIININDFYLKFNVNFLNKILSFFSFRTIKNLKIYLEDNKVILKGNFIRKISIPFSFNIYLKVSNNKIKFEFNNIWLFNLIPLPKFINNLFIEILGENLSARNFSFHQNFLILDLNKLNFPFDFSLNKIEVKKDFLYLEG